MAVRQDNFQLFNIYRLLIGFQKCTNENCPYCDLDFLRARVAAYIDKPLDRITPENLYVSWKYLHPNIKTPTIDDYYNCRQQGVAFAQDYLDWFY